MEFLSDEWCVAANLVLRDIELENLNLTIAYVSEKSSHSIVLNNGSASFHSSADSADVTLRMTTEVADEVRDGSLSALTAIQAGLIAVEGDIQCLISAAEPLAAIDEALSHLT